MVDVNWAKAGDLWLPLGSNDLYHSTDAGVTWTKLANVSDARAQAPGDGEAGAIQRRARARRGGSKFWGPTIFPTVALHGIFPILVNS